MAEGGYDFQATISIATYYTNCGHLFHFSPTQPTTTTSPSLEHFPSFSSPTFFQDKIEQQQRAKSHHFELDPQRTVDRNSSSKIKTNLSYLCRRHHHFRKSEQQLLLRASSPIIHFPRLPKKVEHSLLLQCGEVWSYCLLFFSRRRSETPLVETFFFSSLPVGSRFLFHYYLVARRRLRRH